MFLTVPLDAQQMGITMGRNPLKSGQCFLQKMPLHKSYLGLDLGRNPLKSGQCFLQIFQCGIYKKGYKESQSPQIGSMFLTLQEILKPIGRVIFVAIPSNRVNVSYIMIL